jgi:uncharacterized protein YciI
MKYALLYEAADSVAARAPEFIVDHRAWYQEFHRRGALLLVGPFTDQSGSLAVCTSRAAAEELAAGDSFVRNGLVTRWFIREWLEVLVPEDVAGPAGPAAGE